MNFCFICNLDCENDYNLTKHLNSKSHCKKSLKALPPFSQFLDTVLPPPLMFADIPPTAKVVSISSSPIKWPVNDVSLSPIRLISVVASSRIQIPNSRYTQRELELINTIILLRQWLAMIENCDLDSDVQITGVSQAAKRIRFD